MPSLGCPPLSQSSVQSLRSRPRALESVHPPGVAGSSAEPPARCLQLGLEGRRRVRGRAPAIAVAHAAALPAVATDGNFDGVSASAGGGRAAPPKLFVRGDEVVLRLARRKNKLYGSTLVRKCLCEASPTTCPMHVLAELIESTPVGQPIFGATSPKEANADLRRRLAAIDIPNAHQFTLYAMRRGHAMDHWLSRAPGSGRFYRRVNGARLPSWLT